MSEIKNAHVTVTFPDGSRLEMDVKDVALPTLHGSRMVTFIPSGSMTWAARQEPPPVGSIAWHNLKMDERRVLDEITPNTSKSDLAKELFAVTRERDEHLASLTRCQTENTRLVGENRRLQANWDVAIALAKLMDQPGTTFTLTRKESKLKPGPDDVIDRWQLGPLTITVEGKEDTP